MKQNRYIQSPLQLTDDVFMSPADFVRFLQKFNTIDQTKRITRVSQKGQRNKVIIGRRNAISRISSEMKNKIQSIDYGRLSADYTSRQVFLQGNKQSSIIEDFNVIEQFFHGKFERRLLYRGSQNNFSTKIFHQKCDGFPNTLVLCKTQGSHIIGGFTPLTWDCEYQTTGTYFKTDTKNQTFLFSVTEQQKYLMKKSNRNKSICCFQKYGPTFGGGYDLCIGQNASQQSTTFSYFPRNFQCSKDIQQQRNVRFTGCSKNSFKLKQWQVFQLRFKQRLPIQQFAQVLNKIKVVQGDVKTPIKVKKQKQSRLSYLKKFFSKLFN